VEEKIAFSIFLLFKKLEVKEIKTVYFEMLYRKNVIKIS